MKTNACALLFSTLCGAFWLNIAVAQSSNAVWIEGFGQGNLEYFIDQKEVQIYIGCPTKNGSANAVSSVSVTENGRTVKSFQLAVGGITYDGPFEADSRVGDDNFISLFERLRLFDARLTFNDQVIEIPRSNAADVLPPTDSAQFECNLYFTTDDPDNKSGSIVVTRNFQIVNGTNQVINKIFISSSQSGKWGIDLLGDEVLGNGYERGYTLGERADCTQDIRVEYAGGWVEEKYKMNLCQLERVVFNGDNAKRTEAQPQGSATRSSAYDGSEPLRCGQNVNCSSQSEVVSKMGIRWAKFSSTTHFSAVCLEAIDRMRSMHSAVWGDGHPGFVQPQLDACNLR